MTRLPLRAAAFLCGFAATSAATAGAQSLGLVAGRDYPEWLEAWSPLSPQGDLPRHLPSASPATPLLLLPEPRVGLFWSAGNPAGLAWDVTDSRGDAAAIYASQDGALKRPLDPASSSLTQFTGMGWQPLPARGAGIGRVTFSQDIRDPSSMSDVNEPYPSSPFVITDTTSSALRRTRARLEAAGGWRVGGWGFGVAAGHEALNTTTVAAPLARRNRSVNSAATIGISRSFAGGQAQIGAHAELGGGQETVALMEFAEEGAVAQLEGYREVPVFGFQVVYGRRVTTEKRTVGLNAAGNLARGKWVLFADGTHYRERPTSQQQDNPATDLWATTGGSGGAAIQFPLGGERALLTATGKFTKLSGDAEQVLPSLGGFHADERSIDATAELRMRPTRDWTGVLSVSLLAEHRERNDSIAKATTSVDGMTPRVQVEVGRFISQRFLISGGYAIANYTANATIPSLSTRGPVYRQLIAPEVDIETTGSRAQSFSVVARYDAGHGPAVWIAGRGERLSSNAPAGTLVPFGDRTGKTIWLGVTLAGKE
jgi:hypothetical protein